MGIVQKLLQILLLVGSSGKIALKYLNAVSYKIMINIQDRVLYFYYNVWSDKSYVRTNRQTSSFIESYIITADSQLLLCHYKRNLFLRL